MTTAAPEVMISHSDDGGHTFSHEQVFPLQTDENRLNRIILRRQGSAYQRVYRLKCSDDVSFTLVSAHADITVSI